MSAALQITHAAPVGRWVRASLLPSTWGITTEAARKYRERGIWLEGKHWRKDPTGRVVYNSAEIDQWFETGL
ncbi:excisionase family protein [Marinobacterium stanieri]|uniref:Putative excisionase n=1 Tax=Marinobacterium stanieri TaxID=49186 RepID=A0A1N6QE38_9GAMM|nr:excisionase family protein [Marinobacterium stanieri]SIQ14782.1 Putative excisionase [Marinobacterium stanieri]